MKTIDLAEKRDGMELPAPVNEKEKGPYYPCLYVGNHDGLDGIALDQEVTMKGRIKSVTKSDRDGKSTYSCEIEVKSLDLPGGQAKPDAKKAKAEADEDEIDQGMRSSEKKMAKKEKGKAAGADY